MFQSGKELENLFYTEAAFYKLQTHGENQICRSLVSISRIGAESEGVDALFVLLNPGKCLPLAGEDSIPLLSGEVADLPLTPATPDNTLYQLMRLMERMNWNSVQVINLTDLRTRKFEEYKEGQRFMKQYGDNRHTIFSMDRYVELLGCVEQADTVIAGWGTKAPIIPAAENAHILLWEVADIKGLAYKTHPLYYHPFPWLQNKCIKWLDDMEAQLKRTAEVV
ncbi:DUF1643 domain-containing protein [uncultured Planococcus sp.]|uniref:DUF1643 domain-containing protein n=1 Tax=uncultured Planococcus sp. TaxID=337815 RepID=UPI00262AFD1E|nr:DUF1643 domain-containing protein [uncultured Planococcus sp.]